MRVIGLTGGIGSGKSTVSCYLQKNGFAIVDADKIAREIVEPGSPILARLAEDFGDVLFADGSLDRKKLGAMVFADCEKKKLLDRITHGEIGRRMECAIRSFSGATLFLDVPLLFESGMDCLAQEVWVVDAEDPLRIERVVQRDGLSREEVQARIDRQMPREEKLERADRVLDNSGSLQELYAQIDQWMGEER